MARFLFIALMAACVTLGHAQRPFYAGLRPIGYPELASRFDDTTETTTAGVSLVNRVGEDGQPITTQRTTTERLPVDALGQKDLIDRIKTWPREKWPFWYLNYVAIEEQRARPVSGPTLNNRNQGQQPATTGTGGSVDTPVSRPATPTREQQVRQWNQRNWDRDAWNRQAVRRTEQNGQNQNQNSQPSQTTTQTPIGGNRRV